jgi:hypothetical protein
LYRVKLFFHQTLLALPGLSCLLRCFESLSLLLRHHHGIVMATITKATTTEHIRDRLFAKADVVAANFTEGPDAAVNLQPKAAEQPEAERCLDPPGKIRRHLYIGSRETESCLSALQAAGITHILQAGGELRPSFPEQFTYKKLSVSDEEDEDLVAVFKEAFDFIDEGRKSGEQQS